MTTDTRAKEIAQLAGYYSTGLEAASLAQSSPEAIKLLRQWLNFGWTFRLKRTQNANMRKEPKEYIKRVEAELDVIITKGFVDYFLVTSDLVRFAKDHQIPVGPAQVRLRLQLFATYCESLKSIPFSTPICYSSVSLIRLEKKLQTSTLTSMMNVGTKSLNTQPPNMVRRMLGILPILHGIAGRTL